MAEEATPQTLADLGFTPIDARHLSSLPLIQGRVMKLLKASHNHIHAANNMLLKIVGLTWQWMANCNFQVLNRDSLILPRLTDGSSIQGYVN